MIKYQSPILDKQQKLHQQELDSKYQLIKKDRDKYIHHLSKSKSEWVNTKTDNLTTHYTQNEQQKTKYSEMMAMETLRNMSTVNYTNDPLNIDTRFNLKTEQSNLTVDDWIQTPLLKYQSSQRPVQKQYRVKVANQLRNVQSIQQQIHTEYDLNDNQQTGFQSLLQFNHPLYQNQDITSHFLRISMKNDSNYYSKQMVETRRQKEEIIKLIKEEKERFIYEIKTALAKKPVELKKLIVEQNISKVDEIQMIIHKVLAKQVNQALIDQVEQMDQQSHLTQLLFQFVQFNKPYQKVVQGSSESSSIDQQKKEFLLQIMEEMNLRKQQLKKINQYLFKVNKIDDVLLNEYIIDKILYQSKDQELKRQKIKSNRSKQVRIKHHLNYQSNQQLQKQNEGEQQKESNNETDQNSQDQNNINKQQSQNDDDQNKDEKLVYQNIDIENAYKRMNILQQRQKTSLVMLNENQSGEQSESLNSSQNTPLKQSKNNVKDKVAKRQSNVSNLKKQKSKVDKELLSSRDLKSSKDIKKKNGIKSIKDYKNVKQSGDIQQSSEVQENLNEKEDIRQENIIVSKHKVQRSQLSMKKESFIELNSSDEQIQISKFRVDVKRVRNKSQQSEMSCEYAKSIISFDQVEKDENVQDDQQNNQSESNIEDNVSSNQYDSQNNQIQDQINQKSKKSKGTSDVKQNRKKTIKTQSKASQNTQETGNSKKKQKSTKQQSKSKDKEKQTVQKTSQKQKPQDSQNQSKKQKKNVQSKKKNKLQNQKSQVTQQETEQDQEQDDYYDDQQNQNIQRKPTFQKRVSVLQGQNNEQLAYAQRQAQYQYGRKRNDFKMRKKNQDNQNDVKNSSFTSSSDEEESYTPSNMSKGSYFDQMLHFSHGRSQKKASTHSDQKMEEMHLRRQIRRKGTLIIRSKVTNEEGNQQINLKQECDSQWKGFMEGFNNNFNNNEQIFNNIVDNQTALQQKEFKKYFDLDAIKERQQQFVYQQQILKLFKIKDELEQQNDWQENDDKEFDKILLQDQTFTPIYRDDMLKLFGYFKRANNDKILNILESKQALNQTYNTQQLTQSLKIYDQSQKFNQQKQKTIYLSKLESILVQLNKMDPKIKECKKRNKAILPH